MAKDQRQKQKISKGEIKPGFDKETVDLRVDQIVLLNRGRVAGTGTFAELAQRNTEFAELVALGSLELDSDTGTPLDEEGHLR